MFTRRRQRVAFTLIELMIAILFLSIGFFGYVALHSRILFSGQKLEKQEVLRSSTDFYGGLETARVRLGFSRTLDADPYKQVVEVPGLYELTTQPAKYGEWLNTYPECSACAAAAQQGLPATMELQPYVLQAPGRHTWKER